MITVLEKPIPFGGGVLLPSNKAMSLEQPLRTAALPARVSIPLRQYIGFSAKPIVKIGEYVFKGQRITQAQGYVSPPIHASTSGKIIDIADHPIPDPSGMTSSCIVIEADGKDEWFPEKRPIDDYYLLSPVEVQQRVLDSGIVGLGGAGFPSAVKLIPGLNLDIELLILNAAECEPYISCDESLIINRSKDIVLGLEILAHALQVDDCVIAIEENKTEAIAILQEALTQHATIPVRLIEVSDLYPAGGEKQLVKSLTGIEIPAEGLPVDVGIVCYNVGTAAAVKRAVIDNEPLLSRIVTVTGTAINQPTNLEALMGTSLDTLINECGGYTDNFDYLVMGGPMMGFQLHSDQVPLTKTTNCLLAVAKDHIEARKKESDCIRCDECAPVCPVNLQPQQLHWYSKQYNPERLTDYHLFDCIECGCCSYVCPSNIPLVDNFRHAKSTIWSARRQQIESRQNQKRFLEKNKRLEQAKEQKKHSKSTQKNVAADTDIDKQKVISAAVMRVREKRQSKKTDG